MNSRKYIVCQTSLKFHIFLIQILTILLLSSSPFAQGDSSHQSTILVGETLVNISGQDSTEEVHNEVLSQKGPNLITMDVKNMNIMDVLRIISDKGNLNIVLGRGVGANVTISLKDIEIEEALAIILDMNGLAYVKEDNVIKVFTEQEYEIRYGKKPADRKITRVFTVKYANIASILNTLNQMKTPTGRVIMEERSNKIIVYDLPEQIKDMGKVLEDIDLPTVTRVFELIYADPQQVSANIRQVLSKDAKIQVDLPTNKIIVIDILPNIEKAAEWIKESDQKPPTETRIFDLNYAKADKVKADISPEVTKVIGSVQISERTNKLIVTDLPEKMPRLENLIAASDERTRQVLIESKIIQIALKDSFKMGVDWHTLFKQTNIPEFDVNTSFSILGENEGGTVKVFKTEANGNEYQLLLEALKTVGRTNLLSSPRILVTNGEEAKILVGSNVPYKTVDTTESQGIINKFEKVTFVDVGVKLLVTPTIGKDGFISMKIKPEVSSVVEFKEDVPVVETSEAETNIVVRDGETIIIAGLVKDNRIKTTNKIPLLGDIPIINVFFRSKSDEVEKTELAVFLTPQLTRREK